MVTHMPNTPSQIPRGSTPLWSYTRVNCTQRSLITGKFSSKAGDKIADPSIIKRHGMAETK